MNSFTHTSGRCMWSQKFQLQHDPAAALIRTASWRFVLELFDDRCWSARQMCSSFFHYRTCLQHQAKRSSGLVIFSRILHASPRTEKQIFHFILALEVLEDVTVFVRKKLYFLSRSSDTNIVDNRNFVPFRYSAEEQKRLSRTELQAEHMPIDFWATELCQLKVYQLVWSWENFAVKSTTFAFD